MPGTVLVVGIMGYSLVLAVLGRISAGHGGTASPGFAA
jgi:hypothetical protein